MKGRARVYTCRYVDAKGFLYGFLLLQDVFALASSEVGFRSEEVLALLAVRANRFFYFFESFLGFQVEIELIDTIEEAVIGLAVFLGFHQLGLLFSGV